MLKIQKRNVKNGFFFLPAKKSNLTIFFLISFLFGVCFSFLVRVPSTMAGENQINVSLHVPGTTEEPGLNAKAKCQSGNPIVELSWNTVNNATAYEIYRNSSSIATNLKNTSYKDAKVKNNTSYKYQISAISKDGNTFSQTVTVDTDDCKKPVSENGKSVSEEKNLNPQKPVYPSSSNPENHFSPDHSSPPESSSEFLYEDILNDISGKMIIYLLIIVTIITILVERRLVASSRKKK